MNEQTQKAKPCPGTWPMFVKIGLEVRQSRIACRSVEGHEGSHSAVTSDGKVFVFPNQ